jgi:hypothetical protein
LPSSLLRQHQRRHPDPIRENSCAAGPKGLESAAVHRPLPRPCIGMGCSRTALCGVVARHHRGLPMLAPRGVGFRYTRRRTNHGIRHVICRLSRRAIYCRRARNTDHTTTQPQPVDRATITHQIEAGAGTGDETARLTATIAVSMELPLIMFSSGGPPEHRDRFRRGRRHQLTFAPALSADLAISRHED